MSNPGEADTTPIRSRAELADWFESGCKPPAQWRIGTEHEMFGFVRTRDYAPPLYAPDGIAALLEALADRLGATRIEDAGRLIGLKLASGASVSLEPAGQLELSGRPTLTLHETEAELAAHFAAVEACAAPLGLGFAPLGFQPLMTQAAMPWMPKGRYAIMRRYMPTVGTRGLDMMTRTCTVQVNLDFASETDMRRKLRASLCLQPLASALFANGPFTDGRPNGLVSERLQVWTDVDHRRSGIPAGMLDPGYGFAEHVAWLIDQVPMYFVMRDGVHIDVAGASFADFLAGRLADRVPGPPTLGDFADHVTTAFTDVRLKRYLEMRGADAGSPGMLLAQSSLWTGLLYDPVSLDAVEALTRDVGHQALLQTRAIVPRLGLDAAWAGDRYRLRDIAADVVAIARAGLTRRGFGEADYLDPLEAIAAGAPTQAETHLAQYHGAWKGDVRHLFETEAAAGCDRE